MGHHLSIVAAPPRLAEERPDARRLPSALLPTALRPSYTRGLHRPAHRRPHPNSRDHRSHHRRRRVRQDGPPGRHRTPPQPRRQPAPLSRQRTRTRSLGRPPPRHTGRPPPPRSASRPAKSLPRNRPLSQWNPPRARHRIRYGATHQQRNSRGRSVPLLARPDRIGTAVTPLSHRHTDIPPPRRDNAFSAAL